MKVLFILSVLMLNLILTLAADSVKELSIETVKNGDCSRKAKSGDTLHMHYEGKLMDGTEFDSSYKRGEPFVFTLGSGMVIQGWDKGLLDTCMGEIRNLVIPHSMAYGEQGYPPIIPAKSDLKFKVELIKFGSGGDDEL